MLDAGVQRASRRPVIARITTDEGIYGDGEAGIALGTGAPGAFGMVQDLSRLIIGMDPFDTEKIYHRLLKSSFWGIGSGAIVMAGISALDIALLDIKGKALGVPVFQLLGGKTRNEMRNYASQLQFGWCDKIGPFGKSDDYVRITEYALSQGYDCVKIDFTQFDRNAVRMGTNAVEGILPRPLVNMIDERMGAIRSSLGYDFDIIVENHCRTDAISGTQIGELCDKYKVMAYEEPAMPQNPEMHKVIRSKIKTPIATGERIYGTRMYYIFLKLDAVQLIQPDICNCGGLTEGKKICDIAAVFDATVQAHCAGSPISTAAALHLEAAISNFCIHEHHFRSTQPALTSLCKYDYQPRNGKFYISDYEDKPGLGQEMSKSAMENALMHVTVDEYWRGL